MTNAGTIGGSLSLAAGGAAGAIVTNLGSGVIEGSDGLVIKTVPGSVTNAGTISGTIGFGVDLRAGGSVTNQSAGIINGGSDGIRIFGAAGTVANAGLIGGGHLGVYLIAGGNVTNLNTGTISGSYGMTVLSTAGTVTNAGSILGNSGNGVLLNAGGAVTNLSGGMISGEFNGLKIFGAAGTVVNAGDILGTVAPGVVMNTGGAVTNLSTGTISGGGDGIYIVGGAGTVTNAGTISGGPASVKLSAGFANRVIADPGAVFSGAVDGGNTIGASGTSTLELATGGTVRGQLPGLGSQFINFAQVSVDSAAYWALSGTNTLVSGTTLTNAGELTIANGALADSGAVVNNGQIEDAGALTIGTLTGTGQVLIGPNSVLTTTGAVAATQTIVFTGGGGLLDLTPSGFAGIIQGFESGTAIELAGVSNATSASIVNGNTLAVTLAAGGPINLTLAPDQVYANLIFVVEAPGGSFGANDFIAVSGPTGPTIVDGGASVSVSGMQATALAASNGGLGGITVSGPNSALMTTVNAFTVGDTSTGNLSVGAGGTVNSTTGAVIANTAAASGSSVTVSGAGANWQVNGLLGVGLIGSGSLQLSGGAAVTAGSLDAGVTASAVGQVSLSGIGTSMTVTGAATVADDGTGVLSVLNGATFSADSLTIGSLGNSSGALVVSGAGSVINLTGALNIGTALGVGDLTIGPGGAVHAGVVNLQGQVVLEGGNLDPTVTIINQGQTAGGNGTLQAGDIIDEGVIQAGGTKPSQRLLIVQGAVLGGGTLTINGTVQPSNAAGVLQINASGTMELTGPVLNAATTTFTDNLAQPGTYTVNNSVVDVTFADGLGVLLLDDIAGFGGTITSFKGGDSFVISGGILSNLGVSNSNTLTFSDGGVNAGSGGIDQIIFGSAVSGANFNIANGNTIQVACFAEGTRIETANGPIAVEDLTAGDLAATDDGRFEPITWIGSRTVNCARHPKPGTVWPIRVSAGAFGPGLPARELWLSPDHAVFVNGVLVPVKLLANGSTITQVEWSSVTYYHVELRRHEIIRAEGLSVESYLDVGDRMDFNGYETIRLFPGFAAGLAPDAADAWEMRGAAPLVMAGEELANARRLVGTRASRQNGNSRGAAISRHRLPTRRSG